MEKSAYIPGIEYMVSRREVNTLHVRDGVHRSGKYLMLFFARADSMLSVRQSMLSLTDHCIVLLPPDTPYSFSFGSVSRYIRISVRPLDADSEAVLYRMTHKNMQLLTCETAFERESVFGTAEQLLSLRGDLQSDSAFLDGYGKLLASKLLMDIQYRQAVLRRNVYAGERPGLTEMITRYIRENYTQDITLEDLSRRFFHSKYYISRHFHKTTGVTITEFINRQRIGQACEQLSDSTRSISDICYDSGFRNLQHFYSQFRRFTGHSPLQYRKTVSRTN